jgi:hypothetical protein
MTKVKHGYKNKDGYILNINGFERLNGGKKLSRSQKALLGLKKVKITKDANGYTKEFKE